jgi:hypothetical protein
MNKSSLWSGMSSGMVAAAIGTIVLCVFVTIKLEASRQVPQDHFKLDSIIVESRTSVDKLMAAPVLPPLSASWREVYAAIQIQGLDLSLDESAATNGTATAYSGPLKSWSGSVAGDAKTVLSTIKMLQKIVPVYLLDYSSERGVLKLYLAVVGI